MSILCLIPGAQMGLLLAGPSGYLMSDPEGMKSVEEIRSSIEQQAPCPVTIVK